MHAMIKLGELLESFSKTGLYVCVFFSVPMLLYVFIKIPNEAFTETWVRPTVIIICVIMGLFGAIALYKFN